MTLLSQTERHDFFATVVSAGFSKEDFTVDEFECSPVTQHIYPIRGKVTVKRISSSVSREYLAGHATTWLADFEVELRGCVFGSH